MILHLDDWKKYPTAIVDVETKNRSFVELAYKYKKMGLKNYFFHLALIQPELQGIDPFSPLLTPEQKVKIAIECRTNPWYFFREVFRLPSQGGPEPDPLRANRGNIGTYWLYFNNVDVALVQPRQTGKSVGADGINIYVTQVAGRNATFSLITKDNDLRGKNVQRLKDIRDLLPTYLNPYQKNIDSNNQINLTAHIYGNLVNTGVAQSAVAQALNLGRGTTSESNQVDEVPFCSLIHITMAAFLSSGNAARANAKRKGAFFGNIFTTTAGKLDTKEGKYTYELFMGGVGFDERILFDAGSNRELHSIVERNTKADAKPLVYICMSHTQLGYSNAWIYKKMRESNSRNEEADRDYFNRWTTGSAASPLSVPLLKVIKDSEADPQHIEITKHHYCINWYIPKNEIDTRLKTGKFVMGNDTSEGVGKDAITMVLQDVATLEVIASVALTETNIYRFTTWFTDMMLKYPSIVCIPERKSQGVALIDTLIMTLISKNINPFKRIYNSVIDEGLHMNPKTAPEYAFLDKDPITWPSWVADKYKKRFGYGTAGSGLHSRDNLYVDTLTRLAELNATSMFDKRLISEVCALMEKNGRIDHPTKGHDDTVIAWLLNGWFLLHSKNLDYYGISNPARFAKHFQEEEKAPLTIKETKKVEAQDRFVNMIKDLTRELEASNLDPVREEGIEARIRILSRRLSIDVIESKSIDDLIKTAKEQRFDSLRGKGRAA